MTLKTYNEQLKRIRANPASILKIPFAERTEALLREAFKRDATLVYNIDVTEMDERFCRAVVKVEPRRLDYLPKNLITTDVLELAIEYREMLKYAPESSLTAELVDDALAMFPLSVKFLPSSWITSDRAEYVVTQDPLAFDNLPEPLKTSELACLAVKAFGRMLTKVDPALWDDDLVDSALNENPAVIFLIKEPWLTEARVLRSVDRIGGSKLKLYRHTPEQLKTDALKWRFLQDSLDVIEEITVPEFKKLLVDFHPVEPLFKMPGSLDSALKQLLDRRSKDMVSLAAKYIAAKHPLEELEGKKLDSIQITALSPYFETKALLATAKVKPEHKREVLSADLDL